MGGETELLLHVNNEPTTKSQTARVRLVAMDLVRGAIMIIMAWDHVKFKFSNYVGSTGGSMMWYGPMEMYGGNYGFWFAREVSHICAPLFSYLMGTGMVFVYESRMRKGWTRFQVFRYFATRSAVLIFMGFVTNAYVLIDWIYPMPQLVGTVPIEVTFHGFVASLVSFWDILSSLGLQMIIAATVMLFFPPTHLKTTLSEALGVHVPERINFRVFALLFGLLALTCQLVAHGVVHVAQHGNPATAQLSNYHSFGGFLYLLFFLPGTVGTHFMSMDAYPVISWIGCVFLGVSLAHIFTNNKGRSAFIFHGKLGVFLLLLFTLIRLVGTGVIGNLRGWPLNEGMDYPVMSFFNVCKYPPSLAYVCLMLGIDFLLMFFLSFIPDDKAPRWPSRPLFIFGRVPFFYYMLHLLLIHIISVIFWVIQKQSTPNYGIPLQYTIPIWIGIVSLCYPFCVRYDNFKSSTAPDSLWRLL